MLSKKEHANFEELLSCGTPQGLSGELANVVSWCRRMAKGDNAVCLLVQHEEESALLDQTQPEATHWGRDRSSGVSRLYQEPYPLLSPWS